MTPSVRGWQATAIVSAFLVAIIAVVIAIFASLPMKGTYYNCGTIFASSDSWTYKSGYDSGHADLKDHSDLKGQVDELFGDINRGANAADSCASEHDDRRTLLIVLGSAGVVIALAGGYAAPRYRRLSSA